MKKEINRGFLFYFLLLLGIVLGVFAICAVVMIFVPEFSLFGVRAFNEKYSLRKIEMAVYSNIDSETVIDSVLMNDSSYSIKRIEINANAHSVKVLKSNDLQGANANQFVAVFNYQKIGFTKSETVIKSSGEVRYYLDTKTLKIDFTSPEGLISLGGAASLFLQIPYDYYGDTSNIDLVINAKQSVVIGDEFSAQGNEHPSTVDFKSVNIKTEKDIFITKYATIGKSGTNNCSFITKNGNITIVPSIKAKDLTIKSNESTVRMNEDADDNSFVLNGKFRLITNNSFVHLGNFSASKSILKNIYGKMYFKDITGNIVIDQDSYKCEYKFRNVNGDLTMGSYFDEYMIENGNVSVEESVNGNVVLATTGNIDISKVTGSVTIKNTNGAINLKQSVGAINIESVDGDISLGSKENRILSRVNVLITGKGDLSVYFGGFQYAENIDGHIKGNKSNLKIYLANNMDLNLDVAAGKSLEYLNEKIKKKEYKLTIGVAKKLWIKSNTNVKILSGESNN